jgi:1,4-alpha-glucan branching enzyme
MLDKRVEAGGQVQVTFRLPPELPADRGHVVGDFNGWSLAATPMAPDGASLVAQVHLRAGGRYRFRYLLDGHRWANDWAADDYVANSFGGEDSVVDLTSLHDQTVLRPGAIVAVVGNGGGAHHVSAELYQALTTSASPWPPRR